MKKPLCNLLLFTFITFSFNACDFVQDKMGRTYETEKGMARIIDDLNKQFGKNAGYKSVVIGFDKSIGTYVSATGTNDVTGKTMVEKTKSQGFWKDSAEIVVELERNAKLKDFIYTLDEINLEQIPDLVQQAKEKVSKEKNIEDLVANMVAFTIPDRLGKNFQPSIDISLEPANGGTDFTIEFDPNGNLVDMRY